MHTGCKSYLKSLERLLTVAQGNTDQGRVCANFLLAWWNASSCGGFDLTDLSQLNADLRDDCLTVFAFIAEHHHAGLVYRDRFNLLGYTTQFQLVIDTWRPGL